MSELILHSFFFFFKLCLKKGDVITVTQAIDGGWWEGTLNGITGWFPSNYIKEIKTGLFIFCFTFVIFLLFPVNSYVVLVVDKELLIRIVILYLH